MRSRAWVVPVVALASACSLLTSLDNLGRDASTDAAVDATIDAVLDVVESDSPSDVDARAPDASFCPTIDAGVVFCDNFDDSDASVFPKWSKLVASGGATVTRVSSDASAPFGVELALPQADGGPQAELAKAFVVTPTTRMTYSYRVRIAKFPSGNGHFNLCAVEAAGTANAGATDFLAMTASGASLSEQFAVDSGFQTLAHPLTNGIQVGTWVAVHIEWALGDGGVVVSITFDGVPVISPTALDPRTVFSFPFVIAGMSYEDPASDGVDVEIDDVVITIE